MNNRTVTVFGTSRTRPGQAVYEAAEELGYLLGKAGFRVVNGGYGGSMEAVSKGVRRGGSEVVGVTCTVFRRGRCNEFITGEISTCSLEERIGKLVEAGDAYVVLPGGTGTLLELAMVWELKNKGFLAGGKPIILIGGFWQPLIGIMEKDDPGVGEFVEVVDGASEAVEVLKKHFDIFESGNE